MKNYKKEALVLAKKSILEEFWLDSLSDYKIKNKELLENWACFVTLKTLNNTLRWCIWSIIPHKKLYEDIVSNAKSSAFNDPRFDKLRRDELNDLRIDISILTPLKELKFDDLKYFLSYIEKNKPWIVIKLWYRQATFLPSVWEELSNENDFLRHLVFKAWIDFDEFKDTFLEVEIYEYYSDEFWEKFSKI